MNNLSRNVASSTDPYLKKLRRRGFFTGLAVAVLLIAVVVASTVLIIRISKTDDSPQVTPAEVMELWQAKDYVGVLNACEVSLEIEPLDPLYLTLHGMASFYVGLAETDGERRDAMMENAVFSLRKALVSEESPLQVQANYILGKAYFHRGRDYYDAALRYLKYSQASGYQAADTWEYLALSAQGLQLPVLSVEYFDKALEQSPESPELLVAAAMANETTGNLARVETLALEALRLTSDDFLAERCNFILGETYRAQRRFDEAIERFELIKEMNPQSADAWYHEGLALMDAGDPIRARAAWRKAVAIDPMHLGARQKLSERS